MHSIRSLDDQRDRSERGPNRCPLSTQQSKPRAHAGIRRKGQVDKELVLPLLRIVRSRDRFFTQRRGGLTGFPEPRRECLPSPLQTFL
jgi:hypothetical protein